MPPLLAQDFFAASWTGRGRVTDLFGRTLRGFSLTYSGRRVERESGFLFDEVIAYDDGGELRRSWHIATDGEGALMGLEAGQGGRLLVQQQVDGFTFRFDRLPQRGARNVATLASRLRRQPDGTVLADGWTRWLGVVPVSRTLATLRPG